MNLTILMLTVLISHSPYIMHNMLNNAKLYDRIYNKLIVQ